MGADNNEMNTKNDESSKTWTNRPIMIATHKRIAKLNLFATDPALIV